MTMSDMLDDPAVSRRRIWTAIVSDASNLMGGSVRLGVVLGVLILAIWAANRAVDLGAADPNPNVSFALIALIFVVAGYTGARRSGSFFAGVGVGIVAGAVSALSFPGDYLFGHPWFADSMFIGVLVISLGEGLSLVMLGALVARFTDIRTRVRRKSIAVAAAWREPSGAG